MLSYIARRVLLMLPTLLGLTLVVFVIINLAPGSPIEQKIQQLRFGSQSMQGDSGDFSTQDSAVTEEVIEALKQQYGFDKPIHIRYWMWLKGLTRLDFGDSFTYEEPVIDVIISKFPVSLQFGVISLFLSYLVCIPLGIAKARSDGSRFDYASSFVIMAMYAIPGFMLGILLVVFLASGQFLEIFPMGELYSDDYESFSLLGRIWDRIVHFILPLIAYMVGAFTVLTMLQKNSLMDEIKKDYVRTARAKGLSEKMVLMKHALRNSLIPVVTGIGNFLSIFFAGSLLIERVFNLDGMGLLGYQSLLERDYNVIMGLLFIQSFLMLVGNLLSDIIYVLVDPRIDFT